MLYVLLEEPAATDPGADSFSNTNTKAGDSMLLLQTDLITFQRGLVLFPRHHTAQIQLLIPLHPR